MGNTLEIALAEDGVLFGNKQLPWGISHICVSMTYVFHGHSPYMRYPGVSMDSVCFWKKETVASKKNVWFPMVQAFDALEKSRGSSCESQWLEPSGWIYLRRSCVKYHGDAKGAELVGLVGHQPHHKMMEPLKWREY